MRVPSYHAESATRFNHASEYDSYGGDDRIHFQESSSSGR